MFGLDSDFLKWRPKPNHPDDSFGCLKRQIMGDDALLAIGADPDHAVGRSGVHGSQISVSRVRALSVADKGSVTQSGDTVN